MQSPEEARHSCPTIDEQPPSSLGCLTLANEDSYNQFFHPTLYPPSFAPLMDLMNRVAFLRAGLFLVAIASTTFHLLAAEFDARSVEFFEAEIRPLLAKRCFGCHGPEAKRLEGGLLMNGRQSLLEGGDTGPAITPGKPDESLLIEAITYEGDYEMPPKGKMPDEEIALLTKWIEMGAPWPESAAQGPDPRTGFDLESRKKSHWAWQPIRDPQPPKVKQRDWPLDSLDQFILARLEAEGLSPNGPADAQTLIRRLYFDLLGLPPTPEDVVKWTARLSPPQGETGEAKAAGINQQALAELVDELLASPHFGERWGRHWLDLMRYAESRGHEFDYHAPNAWEYRDYVIRALNVDVPYDKFVIEHIAGDVLDEPRRHPTDGYNESIIATGFWHLGEWVHSPVDIRKDECDRQDNQIDVFGKAFLGMTVACARCHDHKFDAISQRDYYALAGFVQSSAYRLARFETLEHNAQVAADLATLRAESGQQLAALTAQAQKSVVDKFDAYLLAAQAEGDAADAAKKHDLDSGALAALVAHLPAAKDDVHDPLHLWARLALDENQNEEHLARQAVAVLKDLGEKATAARSPTQDTEVIFDFGNCPPGRYITDGSAFGAAPVRVGQPLLTEDGQQPLARFAVDGAARRDLAFKELRLAPGSMNDQGRVGGWQRVGQSVRTPTFTVNGGPVHYLVRGGGRAFAVVDSHRMIQGPLHGDVLMEWNDDTKGEPRWVTHNLARHQGHRVHVEFSPRGAAELEILKVVQGPRPPAVPSASMVAALMSAKYQEAEAVPLEEVARAYRDMLRQANGQVEAGIQPGADSAREVAALANWMLKHPDILIPANAKERSQAAALGARFITEQERLKKQIKTTSRVAMAMWDGLAEDEQFLIRGNHGSVNGTVPRRMLTALQGGDVSNQIGSGRLELARSIVDGSNPLTSRVIVNRIWHHLTGVGIVPTTDNFGVLGLPPSHPELLDHLAKRFAREGWSVKRMIKEVVLSRTYQMSSHPSEASAQDPANRWLHRMRIRRLEGEAIRDAMLAVSGRLDRKMYGPPVPVYLTPFMTGRGRPGSGPLDGSGRRSVYISIRRNFLSPMMLAFDMPQPSAPAGRRTVSNVPAQALIMMNDPLVVAQASVWAKRLLAEPRLEPKERIDLMYQQAFARGPTEAEQAAALAFLSEQAARHGISADEASASPQTWGDLCHVMFNVKEFIFVN